MATKSLSMSHINEIKRKLDTAQKRVAKIKESADEKVQHLVRTTEVGASAFTYGLLRGKFGANPKSSLIKIFDVPTPLLAAAAFHGAGLVGIGGEMSGHLHAFGDGFLAIALYDIGKELGPKMPAGVKLTGDSVSGALPYADTMGRKLTNDEMKSLNRG